MKTNMFPTNLLCYSDMNLSGVLLPLVSFISLQSLKVLFVSDIFFQFFYLPFRVIEIEFGSVQDACACKLIRRHLLPDVCNCFALRISSETVALRRVFVAFRDLSIIFFRNTARL